MKINPIISLGIGVVAILVATFIVATNTFAAPFPYAVGGTGSSTPPAVGQVFYAGATAWQSEATGTITCTGNATCSTTGLSILGGNLTINSTGSGSGLSTSSPISAGNLLEYNSTGAGSAFGVATGTVSGSGGVTVTAGQSIIGSGLTITCSGANSATTGCLSSTDWTTFNNKISSSSLSGTSPITYNSTTGAIACPTCNVSNASVSSIIFGTGLSGGTITTSGTAALLSYISTSSAETSGQVPFWTTTSGTPASLSGGSSAFTFNNTGSLLTVTNASTTNVTVATYLKTPSAGIIAPSNIATSSIVINAYNSASSSVAIGDGTNTHNIFAVHSASIVLASSTLAYYGAFGASGTTTTVIANPLHGSILRSFFCQTDAGTAWVGFTFGSGTETTEVQCTTSGASSGTLSSNNTGTGRQAVKVNVGHSASTPNLITITADVEDTN